MVSPTCQTMYTQYTEKERTIAVSEKMDDVVHVTDLSLFLVVTL